MKQKLQQAALAKILDEAGHTQQVFSVDKQPEIEENAIQDFHRWREIKGRLSCQGTVELANVSESHCSFNLLRITGLPRMVCLLCSHSINRAPQSEYQHVGLHGSLIPLRHIRRPTSQEQRDPFKVLLLMDSVPCHPELK